MILPVRSPTRYASAIASSCQPAVSNWSNLSVRWSSRLLSARGGTRRARRRRGLMWQGGAVGFAIAGAGLLARASWWYGAALALVLVSVALCVVGRPDSRLGILANAVILVVVITGTRLTRPCLRPSSM